MIYRGVPVEYVPTVPAESPEFVAQKLAALAAETIIDVAVERYGDNGSNWHGVI